MDIDLHPLELTPDAERVLRLLLDGRSRSSSSAARELDLSTMATSRAVRLLVERGFVHPPQGRPALLTLAPLREVVANAAEQLQRRAAERTDQLDRLAELLAGHGAPRAAASHQMQGLDVRGLDDEFQREWGRRQVDVIVAPVPWPSFASWPPWRRHGSAGYRVLAPAGSGSVPLPQRGELRRHGEALPALAVVDGERARVDVLVGGVPRHGWTFDPPQVRAVARLFEVLWEESEPEPRGRS